MSKQEASKVAGEMEKAGFGTSFRHYGKGDWAVDGVDLATGVSITINTVEAWEEHKAAREFESKYF